MNGNTAKTTCKAEFQCMESVICGEEGASALMSETCVRGGCGCLVLVELPGPGGW